jgi:hypothetical protein
MVKLRGTIVKDGLIALVFWVVARSVMVDLWGYSGYILSLGLGLLLGVSFIGVTLKRIVNYFSGGGGPVQSAGPASADGLKRACPMCGGACRVQCQSCSGRGVTTTADGMSVQCPYCTGGWRTCLACHGTGLAPGVA